MRQIIKKILRKIINPIVSPIVNPILHEIYKSNKRHSKNVNSQIEQKRLFLYYKQLLAEKKTLPSIHDVGFRFFSQSDEDGILLYLFALIGTINKKCVDIAFAYPEGSNTANLICNFGWDGLLICAKESEVNASNAFFSSHLDTFLLPPRVISKWITAENVNEVLYKNGFSGEIDFFSLDIDGMDYWIWKSLDVIQPRVVVVEFQNIWGKAKKSVTVPYKSDFNRLDYPENFYGASLPAFVKLAKEKGYRLVGCNKYGFNAFFVKKELAKNIVPEVSVEECLSHTRILHAQKNNFHEIAHLDWMEV